MNYNNVSFYTSFGRLDQLPPCIKPEIVFAGRSNVGKSSLINKIFNRKSLARVSAKPGKTSTINFFDGGSLYFADLPGYGYARVSGSEKQRWSTLIEGYLNSDRDIRLVFSLMDMRHPPTVDDRMMVDFLIDSGLPFVVVLTKADKLSVRQQEERLAALDLPCADQITVIPFSTVTGTGVDELRAIIDEIEADSELDELNEAENETDKDREVDAE